MSFAADVRRGSLNTGEVPKMNRRRQRDSESSQQSSDSNSEPHQGNFDREARRLYSETSVDHPAGKRRFSLKNLVRRLSEPVTSSKTKQSEPSRAETNETAGKQHSKLLLTNDLMSYIVISSS